MISETDISRLRSKAAVDRLIKERFGGDQAKLVADINSAINSLLNTDIRRARRFAERTRFVFSCLQARYRPRFTAIEARIEHWSGDSVIARRKYQSALRRLDALGERKAAAQTRQGLMDVYMYLGMHDMAIKTGREALSYFRRVGNNTARAKILSNIGNVYHRTDRNTTALKYYDLARSLLEKQGGAPLVTVDFNRANVLLNLGMVGEAERLYVHCAKEFEDFGLTLAAGKARYSLAYLYFLSDRYTESLANFETVLGVFEDLKDSRSASVTRLDLVEINIELGQYGSAVMLGEEALETLAKSGLRYERAKCAFFVSQALLRLGDNAKSRGYLRLAERLFAAEENRLWMGMVKLAQCRQQLETRESGSVPHQALAARKLFQACGDVRKINDADVFYVEALLTVGKSKDALDIARSIGKRELTSEQRHELNLSLGRYYQRSGKLTIALKHYRQAISAVERMLASLHPDEVRFFFAHARYQTYVAAVECLLSMGKVDKSFVEHSRALDLLNQKRHGSGISIEIATDSDTTAQTSLRMALRKLNKAPDGVRMGADTASETHRIEAKLWANERRRKATAASLLTLPERVNEAVDRASSLAEDEAIISYFAHDERLGAFFVTRGQTIYTECPTSFSELERNVREMQFLMENAVFAAGMAGEKDSIAHYLKEIGEQLVTPIRIPQHVRRLIFLVDGLFAQVPFIALSDGNGATVRNRYSIRTLVNPTDLMSRNANAIELEARRCAVFVAGSSELPLVAVEGNRISEYYPASVVYQTDGATVANLKRELMHADGFIHIAAHASRSSENPLFSRILMSDGPFFPFDLSASGIKAHLVTLSGCQTAAPGVYYGNSFSLARAFQQAGARFVLASLWPVSDKAGLIFMEKFYQSLSVEHEVGAAYEAAVKGVSAISDNPALWSTFVLLGI
jgi:CHAT domain-containing protein